MTAGDIDRDVWAAILLKPPAAAKTRLAHLTAHERGALAMAMAADVVDAVIGSGAFRRVLIVSADPAHARLAVASGAELLAEASPEGLDRAAARAVGAARTGGAFRCALLPGDIPLADAVAIGDAMLALSAGGEPAIGLVPCRRRDGTNMLVCPTNGAPTFSYGRGSFARHMASAEIVRIHEDRRIGLDIDMAEDFDELIRRIAAGEGRDTRTAAMLADTRRERRA